MTRGQLQALPDEIALPLRQLDRKVRLLAALRGLARLVTVLIVGVGAAILLDLWLDLPLHFRVGLLGAVVLAVVAVVVWGIVRPLCWRTGPIEMAAVIETAHPELNERLSSTVELLHPEIDERHKGSPLMRELLLAETTKISRGVDLQDAVDGARAQRAGWIAVAALFLMVLPLFYSRDGYTLLLTRFLAPWRNLDRASNLYFVVDHGDRTVPRGEDVTIVAEPRWRLGQEPPPEEVWLNWAGAGGEADFRRMLWDAEAKVYKATLPHVFHPFDFHVASGAARTRQYHVNVVEAPSISSLVVDVLPPAYTGLPAARLDGAVGETTVFERSQVRFEAAFNKPVTTAEIVWFGATEIASPAGRGANQESARAAASPDSADPVRSTSPLTLAADRTHATLDFEAVPEMAGRFALRITDEHGLQNDEEPLRSLRVQPDAPPTVAFADHVDSPEARPDDVITLPVAASDDIAVDVLELHYTVVPQGARNSIAAEGRLLGVRTVDFAFQLDLANLTTDLGAPLPLKQNDRLRVRARALDERPIPGPNEAWSEDRTITIRDDAAPYGFEMLAQTRNQWRELLRSIREELQKNRDQVHGIYEETDADLTQQLPFDQNESIPPLAAHQREQATRLEQLAALLSASPLFGNLTRPVEAVAREELAAAPRALDAASTSDLPQKPGLLDVSVQQVDAALEKLADLEQGFDRIAELERDLSEIQRLAERAQQLAEDAVALEQERSNPPAKLSPERQQARDAALEHSRQQLAEEHQELTEDISELVDRRPEILDAAREQQFDRLRELARRALELAEPQERLAGEFQQNARDSAAELADETQAQRDLLDQARELAGAVEPNQARRPVAPLDLDQLRSVLDELQAGDAASAAQQQERAAQELERLAAELRKNEQLPDDPQAAARELERRQQALKAEIEPALAEHQAATEAAGQAPDDAPALQRVADARQQLRNLAAAQTALQTAIAHLDVPRDDRDRRASAAKRAFETVSQLLDEKPQRAADLAENTRRSLEDLANNIGDADRRRKDAQSETRRLREQQEQIAREAAEIAKRAHDGQPADQTNQQLEPLDSRALDVVQALAELDLPEELSKPHDEALLRASAAETDLHRREASDAARSTREAAQALADLEQALETRPAAAQRLAELLPRENQLARNISDEADPPSSDDLRDAAKSQRDFAKQVGELRTPLLESQRDEARRQLEEAARAADEAAGEADRLAEARRQTAEAQQALAQLHDEVHPESDLSTPAARQAMQPDLARALAEPAEPLAQLAEQAEKLAQREADLRRQTQELAKLQAEAAEAAATTQTPDPTLSREELERQKRTREEQSREQRRQHEQRANELRQQQQQLADEIRRLPPEAAPLALAEASEHADSARNALAQRNAAEAAPQQLAAEDALNDVAAAARGQHHEQQQIAAAEAEVTLNPNNSHPAPAERLAGRAEKLAAAQRRLAEMVQPARQPPGEPSAAAPANAAATPTADAAHRAQAALAAQQQLAEDAAAMALETAQDTGPDSPAAQAALQLAERAAETAQTAAAGQLSNSTAAAHMAAESAEAALAELAAAPDGPDAELSRRMSEFADRQRSLAGELDALAASLAGRAAVQAQAQDRMAAQADEIAAQFEDVAGQLTAQPLDRPQQGQQAQAAQGASRRASGSIESSGGELTAGNPQQAARAAGAGAEDLRRAADLALQAAGDVPAQPSQVPQSVGQQVASALQQLQQAGEQLAHMPPPGQAGQPQQANAGQPQPGQASPSQTAADAPPMQQPPPDQQLASGEGDGQSGEASSGRGEPSGDPSSSMSPSPSSSLQQVAQSLNQAAEQLGLTPAQMQGQLASGQQASSAGAPTTDGESTDSGAQETVRLTKLEEQLRIINARSWGELPGKLQTEILQSSQQRTGGDYGRVIQRYFEEVSRVRTNRP